MQLKEEHIKILKNVLRNDIAIEKEQLKRLEALKNKLNDKEFMEKLLSTNHFKQRLEELKLKEEKKEHIKNVTKSDIITFAKKLKLNVIYALCEDQNGKN